MKWGTGTKVTDNPVKIPSNNSVSSYFPDQLARLIELIALEKFFKMFTSKILFSNVLMILAMTFQRARSDENFGLNPYWFRLIIALLSLYFLSYSFNRATRTETGL